MADCVNALKAWTGKETATVIYDSTVDEFTGDGIFNKTKGKGNIAVIGFTTDGDVFGGFYSVAVTKQWIPFKDPNLFAFSFESHGRCTTPQRFVLNEEVKEKAEVSLEKNDRSGFVEFCGYDGGFFLGNEKSKSFCCKMSRAFEGLEDTTLTGQNNPDFRFPPYHHCTRLVAVQLG